MLNSTPKKAVILPLDKYHCIICGVEISSQERLSIFGRSKVDFKGAISKVIEGDIQLNEEEHYICTKKCRARLTKFLKLSSELQELKGDLKQEILKCNSVRIKRGISDLSPIKSASTRASREGISTCTGRTGPKKSLFPPTCSSLLLTQVSTPLFVHSSLAESSEPSSVEVPVPFLTPSLSLGRSKEASNNREPSVQVLYNFYLS